MEFHEGVRLAVVRAGALHDPLQAPAVLRIDDDHHVAAPDRLGDQVGECHALAGLGGADQQRAALEVLQRPVQGPSFGSTPWI